MKITKVKHWTKTVQSESVGHVRVAYTDGDSDIAVHQFGEGAEAEPEFYEAFDNMSPYVCKICGLPEELKTGIQVRDISISPSEDKEGSDTTEYRLTGSLKAGHATSTIIVSVQHKFIPEGFAEAVKWLTEKAEEYVQGVRQQTELFDSETQANDEEQTTDHEALAE